MRERRSTKDKVQRTKRQQYKAIRRSGRLASGPHAGTVVGTRYCVLCVRKFATDTRDSALKPPISRRPGARYTFRSFFAGLFRAGDCRSGGMADALDSKSSVRKDVWVQVPPPAFLSLSSSERATHPTTHAREIRSRPIDRRTAGKALMGRRLILCAPVVVMIRSASKKRCQT